MNRLLKMHRRASTCVSASDASTQVEITQVVNSGPAVHVMCREEDENARELVEQVRAFPNSKSR